MQLTTSTAVLITTLLALPAYAKMGAKPTFDVTKFKFCATDSGNSVKYSFDVSATAAGTAKKGVPAFTASCTGGPDLYTVYNCTSDTAGVTVQSLLDPPSSGSGPYELEVVAQHGKCGDGAYFTAQSNCGGKMVSLGSSTGFLQCGKQGS